MISCLGRLGIYWVRIEHLVKEITRELNSKLEKFWGLKRKSKKFFKSLMSQGRVGLLFKILMKL